MKKDYFYADIAEQSVISSLLVNKNIIADVLAILQPDDFYQPEHKVIYRAIQKMYNKGETIDLVTLPEYLRTKGLLDEIGNISTIIHTYGQSVDSDNAVYYAELVLEKAIARELYNKVLHIAESCKHYEDVDELLNKAEQSIYEVRSKHKESTYIAMSKAIEEVWDILEQRAESLNKYTGLETGFTTLDYHTQGFQPSELIIIAARPSVGKSAFALNIAANMSIDKGYPVAFFSLEMSYKELVIRLLASEARVNNRIISLGQWKDGRKRHVEEAEQRIKNAPLYIDDSPGISVYDIQAKTKQIHKRYNIKAIFVDFIQLITPPPNLSRTHELAVISRSLKALAQELNISVVALSQMSRYIERRSENKPSKPKLADLRDSGALEENADVVMFIYRPDITNYNADEEKAQILIEKQRNGPTGQVDLYFHKKYTRFDELNTNVKDTETETVMIGGDIHGNEN